jgi:hypothetical protein
MQLKVDQNRTNKNTYSISWIDGMVKKSIYYPFKMAENWAKPTHKKTQIISIGLYQLMVKLEVEMGM